MTAKDGSDERDKRLKSALRDNLKRRKQAARRTQDSAPEDTARTREKPED